MLQESYKAQDYKAFSEVVSPFDSTDTPWFALHQFLETQEKQLNTLTAAEKIKVILVSSWLLPLI